MRPLPEKNHFDVLIIGAGPAGIAAAVAASKSKCRIGIIDDNPHQGGQIWRGEQKKQTTKDSTYWFEKFRELQISVFSNSTVIQKLEDNILLAEQDGQAIELSFGKLILATGARELYIPFPGWTLPGVCGAGGLQALVKGGLEIKGKRVVVAGSGPLLFPVAAYLKKRGAKIIQIAEQALLKNIISFTGKLFTQPSKLKQAIELKSQLLGIPYKTSSWPIEAKGKEVLQSVIMSDRHKSTEIPCDYLACGFGLIPQTELAAHLGCKINEGAVVVDLQQQTSLKNIFAAGELTGIGGMDASLCEGQIAGLTATSQIIDDSLITQKSKTKSFSKLLKKTFALREELKALPTDETTICRCEDVEYSKIRTKNNWREVKIHTRCGMGSCQGRICGGALNYLFGWENESVRPPVFPARISSLVSEKNNNKIEKNEEIISCP